MSNETYGNEKYNSDSKGSMVSMKSKYLKYLVKFKDVEKKLIKEKFEVERLNKLLNSENYSKESLYKKIIGLKEQVGVEKTNHKITKNQLELREEELSSLIKSYSKITNLLKKNKINLGKGVGSTENHLLGDSDDFVIDNRGNKVFAGDQVLCVSDSLSVLPFINKNDEISGIPQVVKSIVHNDKGVKFLQLVHHPYQFEKSYIVSGVEAERFVNVNYLPR